MKRAALLLALAACGRMNFDPVDDGGGTNPNGDGNRGDGDGNGTGGGTCLLTNGPACPSGAASLSAASTYLSSSNTDVAGNGQAGSCGGTSSGENATQFLVMATATFIFTTRGSALDTVIYAKDTCTGAELACNDDEDATTKTSRLQLSLTAGQSIIIVVDGANGECGPYTLRAGTNP